MPGFTKPPAGAQINWGHPLARNLLEAWMGGVGWSNENAGVPTHSGIVPLVVSKIVPGTERAFDRAGPYGASSYFEPGAAVTTGVTTPAHTGSTGFTYRFIGYLSAATAAQRPLIGNRSGGGPGLSFFRVETGGITYYEGTANQSLSYSATVGNSVKYPAGWYDIVVVHDGVGNLHAYVNGVLDATRTLAAHSANGNPVYLIGDPPANEYGGNLGVIQGAVWWRALTPADVKRLYAEPWAFLAPQSPRIRYFPVGPTVHNASLTIAGAGAVAGTGLRAVPATGTIAGAGAVAATGLRAVPATGTITGTGTIAATGLRTVNATLPITGVGTLEFSTLTPDPNPITLTLTDQGHTLTIHDTGHTLTIRDRGHTLTLKENN